MLGAGDIAGDERDGVPDPRKPQWKMTVNKQKSSCDYGEGVNDLTIVAGSVMKKCRCPEQKSRSRAGIL